MSADEERQLVRIRLLPTHAAQQEILESPARFRVVACGRRFGKTSVAIEEIVTRLVGGERVAYFAPTTRNAADVWRDVKAYLFGLIVEISEHDLYLRAAGGGLLEIWPLGTSFAAQMVRGRKYHLAIIDEAAQVRDLMDLWNYTIRPLLTDYRGRGLFLSTPNGIDAFYELYQRGVGSNVDWQSFRYSTADNPYIEAQEIEAARKEMPERAFRQEYLAEFLTDGGMVFRGAHEVCIAEALPGEPGLSYVFGVDWGKSNDFTCISVIERSTRRQVFLERFNQVSWNLQYGRLRTLYDEYRPLLILAESNSIGDVNIEMLQVEGLPVRGFLTTGRTKPPLIDTLALAIERKEVTLLNNAVLRGELVAYRMERTAAGWSYSAPSGMHDDTVMATALSLYAAVRMGYGSLIDFVERPDVRTKSRTARYYSDPRGFAAARNDPILGEPDDEDGSA